MANGTDIQFVLITLRVMAERPNYFDCLSPLKKSNVDNFVSRAACGRL